MSKQFSSASCIHDTEVWQNILKAFLRNDWLQGIKKKENFIVTDIFICVLHFIYISKVIINLHNKYIHMHTFFSPRELDVKHVASPVV